MWQKCLKVDKWIWLRATCTLKLQWPPRTSAWWWFSRQVVCNSLWPHGLCRPPGSSVHGILHSGTLEWVAISFSKYLHIIYQNVPYRFDGLKSKIWTSFNLSAKLSFFFFSKISSSKINNNYDAAFYLIVCSRDQQHLNHLETF